MSPYDRGRGPWSRRDFLRTGSAAVLATAIPRGMRRQASILPSALGGLVSDLADPDRARAIATAAIDAARSAGATYADARVFREVSQSVSGQPKLDQGENTISDEESLAVGVRVLVDGQWGFAASPYWDIGEAATLARNAVAQAKANGSAGEARRVVELGQYPVASGSWQHPGITDPFSISLEEKLDLLQGLVHVAAERAERRLTVGLLAIGFARQERAVATSDGAYFTQLSFISNGHFDVSYTEPGREVRREWLEFDGLGPSQHGWEVIRETRLLDQLRDPERIQAARDKIVLPHKPIDVGRYDVVFGADAVADLVERTLGLATEIDRSLGIEANSGGTSFLTDPLAMLGSYQMAAPAITLKANRSMPHGLATVKWDDEGVEPDEFTLIKNGVLNDFQTTREQASWLQGAYAKLGRPVRSHGCARSAGASNIPLQGAPNLVLEPGPTKASFHDLVASTKKGIAITECAVETDFQLRTGIGNYCVMREIVDGKLGAFIDGGTFLFNTIEFWKNVVALGGPESAEVSDADRGKGDPAQSNRHSVQTVPMKVHDVTIIERKRKA